MHLSKPNLPMPGFLQLGIGTRFLLVFLVIGIAVGCTSRRRESPSRPYNPCGELQDHLLEIQQIEDDLANTNTNLDKQKELQERKLYLQRQDERLQKDCGR